MLLEKAFIGFMGLCKNKKQGVYPFLCTESRKHLVPLWGIIHKSVANAVQNTLGRTVAAGLEATAHNCHWVAFAGLLHCLSVEYLNIH